MSTQEKRGVVLGWKSWARHGFARFHVGLLVSGEQFCTPTDSLLTRLSASAMRTKDRIMRPRWLLWSDTLRDDLRYTPAAKQRGTCRLRFCIFRSCYYYLMSTVKRQESLYLASAFTRGRADQFSNSFFRWLLTLTYVSAGHLACLLILFCAVLLVIIFTYF